MKHFGAAVTRGVAGAYVVSLMLALCACQEATSKELTTGRWLIGDFHNHTYLTDGEHTPEQVLAQAFDFGLDWIANSEHGGAFSRTPEGQPWPVDTAFLGGPPPGRMWRWQSLWQYSYPLVVKARATWLDKLIVQGYEWNVPAHDHASVAIVGASEEGGLAIARHAYLFDDKDGGSRGASYLGLDDPGRKITRNDHEKAVAGVEWLERQYPRNSYFLINHPSRWQNYPVAAMRDFHDAAPQVAFGFEGVPGHQKAARRGQYDGGPFLDSSGRDVTFKAQTYGGVDYMLAKVGGAWDALLGEGRQFFIFANSDFHQTDYDFWPGEYAKTYTYVQDQNNDGNYGAEEVVAGMRSGNSFVVLGDLIDGLQFSVRCRQKTAAGAAAAEMGGSLAMGADCDPEMIIRFRSPEKNNNGDAVVVDHIDLIAGEVQGRAAKVLADGVTPNPEYEKESNAGTKVVASFTQKEWQEEPAGPDGSWQTIVYPLPPLERDMYFRLRGTNLGTDVHGETDEAGNPLNDELMAPNTKDKAYADLWFYSNPVFVRVGGK